MRLRRREARGHGSSVLLRWATQDRKIRTQDRGLVDGKAMNLRLLRGDDAAYRHAPGEGGGSLEVHGFGGHVGVLEAGARVEEDNFVGRFEVAGGDEGVVGGGGCGPFRGEEDAFVFCVVENAGEDLFVREGQGRATGLADDVEDDGIAVGLGDAETSGEGGGVLEELAGGLAFFEGFGNGGASAGLKSVHLRALAGYPA